MIDIFKKTLYAGIGMAFLTKERIEEMASKLAEESKLSEAEGRKFVNEIINRSEEAKQGFEKTIQEAVDTAFRKLDLPRRSDVQRLEVRIEALESAIAELKSSR